MERRMELVNSAIEEAVSLGIPQENLERFKDRLISIEEEWKRARVKTVSEDVHSITVRANNKKKIIDRLSVLVEELSDACVVEMDAILVSGSRDYKAGLHMDTSKEDFLLSYRNVESIELREYDGYALESTGERNKKTMMRHMSRKLHDRRVDPVAMLQNEAWCVIDRDRIFSLRPPGGHPPLFIPHILGKRSVCRTDAAYNISREQWEILAIDYKRFTVGQLCDSRWDSREHFTVIAMNDTNDGVAVLLADYGTHYVGYNFASFLFVRGASNSRCLFSWDEGRKAYLLDIAGSPYRVIAHSDENKRHVFSLQSVQVRSSEIQRILFEADGNIHSFFTDGKSIKAGESVPLDLALEGFKKIRAKRS